METDVNKDFLKWWEAQNTMLGDSYKLTAWNAWLAATLAERDACAKVCETGDIHEAQIPNEWLDNCDMGDDEVTTRLYCAAFIRMRSNAKVTGAPPTGHGECDDR